MYSAISWTLGFGSGRDSLYFTSKGYEVYAIDPTKSFCDNARKLGINNVYNLYAQDMEFDNVFDGIWACASLLHVPSNELKKNTYFIT
ncbi:MAG: methyltransferase domain-containing protein [Anaeroplasma sp.]